MPAVQNLSIAISGAVDPSLIAAINKTEAQLKQLGASVRTSNAAMKGVYAAAFPAPAEIQKSIDKIGKFHQVMGNITQMGSAFAVGNFLTQGIDLAIAKVGQLVVAMKSASDAAANMEIQKSNLQAAAGLTSQQSEALQAYFWQKSVSVPVTVPTQMAGFKRIEETIQESDPNKKIALGKQESDKLLDLAALAINPQAGGNIVDAINEKYRDIVDVVTKGQMQGIVNQRLLGEFETMGINVRPQMMADKGLITQDQLAHWSMMPEEDRDKLLGEFSKDVKKRSVFNNILSDTINQVTGPGGKAFGRAAAIAGTTGGVESSTADVLNFFNTMVGQIENGPLKQLLGAINAGFAKEIPYLTQIFSDAAVKFDAGFKPILASLEKADWARIGKDAGDAFLQLEIMFEKSKPIFEFLAWAIPKQIDGIIRLITVIEKVGTAIEKAFGWVMGAAENKKADPNVKDLDQFGPTHEGEALHPWFKHTQAVDASTTSLATLNNQIDKVSGNDLVHLNYAIDESTKKLLAFSAAFAGGSGGGDGTFSLSSGYSDGGSTKSARGMLTAFGEQIPFGSGGYRDGAPIPFGDYPLGPNGVGPWGQANNAMGINGGTIWDPTLNRNREGIEMHAGGSNLISEGCVVVPRSKWPSLKKKIIEDYERGGRPVLHVGKEGASISDKPTTQINVHIHAIDSDSFAQTIHKHADVIADHVKRVVQSDWERSAPV